MNEKERAAGLAATPGYRYAEQVGDQLFVAGQVPLDRTGKLLGVGDPEAQTIACLNNLRTLIDVHGFTIADIRRLVIYVAGEHRDLLTAWSAVTKWFDNDVAPATLLGVACLGYAQQIVEIDATVVARRTDAPLR
jgi:enamine deaminase RidA (YjgF/YER057c/UK114 family)